MRHISEEKQTLNNMSLNKVTTLQNEQDQMYQYLMAVVKTLHETLKKFATGIKG